MSRKIFLLLCSCICFGLIYSQDTNYARVIVAKLSSPEMKGRGYVEQGNLLAAEYIASEYKRLDLLPLTKSYFQKFSFSVNTFPGKMTVNFDKNQLIPAVDYLIESSSPSLKGEFKIIKTDRKEIGDQDKFISILKNSQDKFVLIDNSDITGESKIQTKQIDDYISFIKYSPQLSTKGVIIYSKEKLNWECSTFQNIRPIIILDKNVDISSAQKISLDIESNFIKDYETQNVVGYIKGSEQPDSFIVIIAHYDHLGKMGKDTYFPGANDNASGVAMLLNIANYYSAKMPKYSMLFISLSAEEAGVMGAKYFVDNPLIELGKIKFLLNFDLAGTGEEGIRIVNGSVYRDKFDLISKLNSDNNFLPKVDIRGEACNSDHCMFYMKKVPCFYIYTQGGIKAYHDIYDKNETLPLTEFNDYYKLMIKFIDSF